MTTTRRVMPREALRVERNKDIPGRVYLYGFHQFVALTDAEFASAFVDADLFDAVLTAARGLVGAFDRGDFWTLDEFSEYVKDARAALRAFDEGQAQ